LIAYNSAVKQSIVNENLGTPATCRHHMFWIFYNHEIHEKHTKKIIVNFLLRKNLTIDLDIQ